ncbi:MAG: acylphosphatase [Myxococcota bacterium]
MADSGARADILITGKVQGVFYRASTLEKAQGLGLVGWVANLPDGAVEVVAEGPRYALEQLVEWCKEGPPAAEVEDVRARYSSALDEFRTFSIRR